MRPRSRVVSSQGRVTAIQLLVQDPVVAAEGWMGHLHHEPAQKGSLEQAPQTVGDSWLKLD